jgi:hypothetical protein
MDTPATGRKEASMTAARLYRLSGLALLLALPLEVAGWLIHPHGEDLVALRDPLYTPAHLLLLVQLAIVQLGLTGLYARQAGRSGWLGAIGFALTVPYFVLHYTLLQYESFVAPYLAREPATQALVAPGGALAHGAAGTQGAFGLIIPLLAATGVLLLGIATLRAGVFPRAAGWLPLAAVAVYVVASSLPYDAINAPPSWLSPVAFVYYLLYLGYAWGGYALWTERVAAREAAAPLAVPQPVA